MNMVRFRDRSVGFSGLPCNLFCHLKWRDRDCHFNLGDVATAVLIENAPRMRLAPYLESNQPVGATEFEQHPHNNGFLRRSRPGVGEPRDSSSCKTDVRFKRSAAMSPNTSPATMANEGSKRGPKRPLACIRRTIR